MLTHLWFQWTNSNRGAVQSAVEYRARPGHPHQIWRHIYTKSKYILGKISNVFIKNVIISDEKGRKEGVDMGNILQEKALSVEYVMGYIL